MGTESRQRGAIAELPSGAPRAHAGTDPVSGWRRDVAEIILGCPETDDRHPVSDALTVRQLGCAV